MLLRESIFIKHIFKKNQEMVFIYFQIKFKFFFH